MQKSADGFLNISRQDQVTGAATRVKVLIDGEMKAGLWAGGSTTVRLPEGNHEIKVSCLWVSASSVVTIEAGKKQHLEIKYGNC